MSRKVIVLCAALVAACAGSQGSDPHLTGAELREGSVATTLDVLLRTADLLAIDPGSTGGDVYVCGEPVALVLAVDGATVTVEAVGACRTEATLVLHDNPDGSVLVTGTVHTDAPDGRVVEGTLEGVTVRAVADLPGVGFGAIFTSGNVDLGVREGEDLLATGTAALFGRRALVGLAVRGTYTEGELALGEP